MARKTAADRMWEEDRQEKRVWSLLKSKLERISTLKEVVALTQESPADGEPGREFYNHYVSFLYGHYEMPAEATDEEKRVYRGLLERLYANSQLTEEAAERTGVKKPK